MTPEEKSDKYRERLLSLLALVPLVLSGPAAGFARAANPKAARFLDLIRPHVRTEVEPGLRPGLAGRVIRESSLNTTYLPAGRVRWWELWKPSYRMWIHPDFLEDPVTWGHEAGHILGDLVGQEAAMYPTRMLRRLPVHRGTGHAEGLLVPEGMTPEGALDLLARMWSEPEKARALWRQYGGR